MKDRIYDILATVATLFLFAVFIMLYVLKQGWNLIIAALSIFGKKK